jgi:hypothetical protein
MSEQLKYTKENIIGYRNIYIVTFDPTLQFEDCITVDEQIFEFKMDDIALHFINHNGKNNRNGWYLQQLLKLYAGFTIDGILDDYLVVDSDVFFQKKLTFISDDGKYYFTTSDEHHIPYFKHMNKLHESFEKLHPKSGISHHMIFNKNLVKEMFELVETKHNTKFWQIFIEMVDEHKNHDIFQEESGASEYEMYFNFMIKYHSDKMIIREINWKNISNLQYSRKKYKEDLDFISVCNWMG